MQVMEFRRRSLSDVPEALELPAILERSPLLDRRATKSVSVFHLQKQPSRLHNTSAIISNTRKPAPLKTIAGRTPPSISRSLSAPFSRHAPGAPSPQPLHRWGATTPDHAQFRSSPQYRVNPVVRFDQRLLPERMNYGIAGYNTSRRRPRSAVGVNRPKSVHILKLWTRRLRGGMIRIRVRSAYSRFMMRFRRRR